MKGRPIDQMVHEYMFPKPKTTDPQNFHALLQRSLIPEVRQETHSFYGHLDTQEAMYPGLDYNHRTHRIRLSRFTWHRRLFRAFDGLALTKAEISGLTKWEGTKWAKEKFEKEQGVIIRDTTADGFDEWDQIRDVTRITQRMREQSHQSASGGDEDELMEDDESDEELRSVGVTLNQRLRTQAARRDAGDDSAVLDEEWEQWLKNAIERGELSYLTQHLTQNGFQGMAASSAPLGLIPPEMLSFARNGMWNEIPEVLHGTIRRAIDSGVQEPAESLPAMSEATGAASRQGPANLSESLRRLNEATAVLESWDRRPVANLRLPMPGTTSQQRSAGPQNA